MNSDAKTVSEYLSNLPKGFEELCQKITVDEYIAAYEATFNKQANQ